LSSKKRLLAEDFRKLPVLMKQDEVPWPDLLLLPPLF
jgi:hypothetical protein